MHSFLEIESRNFKPMAVPGLKKEVRDAVNAALKAMSSWRKDIADAACPGDYRYLSAVPLRNEPEAEICARAIASAAERRVSAVILSNHRRQP